MADSPLDRMIKSAVRCVLCGAPYGKCDCWVRCPKCGRSFEKGTACASAECGGDGKPRIVAEA